MAVRSLLSPSFEVSSAAGHAPLLNMHVSLMYKDCASRETGPIKQHADISRAGEGAGMHGAKGWITLRPEEPLCSRVGHGAVPGLCPAVSSPDLRDRRLCVTGLAEPLGCSADLPIPSFPRRQGHERIAARTEHLAITV